MGQCSSLSCCCKESRKKRYFMPDYGDEALQVEFENLIDDELDPSLNSVITEEERLAIDKRQYELLVERQLQLDQQTVEQMRREEELVRLEDDRYKMNQSYTSPVHQLADRTDAFIVSLDSDSSEEDFNSFLENVKAKSLQNVDVEALNISTDSQSSRSLFRTLSHDSHPTGIHHSVISNPPISDPGSLSSGSGFNQTLTIAAEINHSSTPGGQLEGMAEMDWEDDFVGADMLEFVTPESGSGVPEWTSATAYTSDILTTDQQPVPHKQTSLSTGSMRNSVINPRVHLQQNGPLVP